MFYTVVILVIVIALLVGYGAFMRRKIYKEVDRFENWKINVMNRPVTEEISKVKMMTMGGETEQKFEIWRRDWDDIITIHLPMVEEELFEVEEYADKYRFKRSRETLASIQTKLEHIEAQIASMLEDLNVIVKSEEENKKNIVPIKERYHNVKRGLITRRGDFKEAIVYLEQELKQLESDLEQYDHETGQGNVISGREILARITEQLDRLEKEILDIPKYYKDIRTILPHRMKELETGVEGMKEEGYRLEHLKIDDYLHDLENHLKVFDHSMEKSNFKEVQEGLEASFEHLEWIYNQLEKEVETRQQLKKEVPLFKHDLQLVADNIKLMNEETEDVQKIYILDESDFKTQETLDRVYSDLQKEFEEVDLVFSENRQSFSVLFEKIEDMRVHLKDLHTKAEAYREKLHHLRQDEWAAKETLQNLKQQLIESRRKAKKSNLPGIPHSYMTLIEEADELLTEVRDKLDEKPLAIDSIQQLLEDANKHVSLVYEKTIEMIESAILTEKLIQYGNRYRRKYPYLDEELKRAEDFFRSYNYVESVEVAASAIERVDPSITKKFQVEVEAYIS